MSELQEALAHYREAVASFRWDVPDAFNFGRDVVDVLGADPQRRALLWRDADGSERRLRFADVAAGSNRVAQLLRSRGVGPGDPLILMLPRIPEWQIVLLGSWMSTRSEPGG